MATQKRILDNYDHLEPIPYQYGVVVTLCTMFAFFVLNRIVNNVGPPKHVKDTWKWRNLFGSWFHALIIGSWDISCFLMYPEMVSDLVGYHDMYCYTMIAVTTGYFFYDFIDIVVSGKTRTSWEVLLHHVVVAGTFFYNLLLCRCIAYTAVALLAEVNSFFLHSRKLMQMLCVSFQSRLYRLNVYLNLGSFVLCRFIPLIWIMYGMCMWYDRVEPSYLVILSFDLLVMWLVNIVLFSRLITNDIRRMDMGKTKAKDASNKVKVTAANNNDSAPLTSTDCNGLSNGELVDCHYNHDLHLSNGYNKVKVS